MRAEWRKAVSTRLWWALLIPVVAVSVLVDAVGGLFTASVVDLGAPSLVPVSLAAALSLTSPFPVLYGVVTAAGEFRHRTVTTTYLLAPRRGAVQVAKSIVAAAVGAGYALVAALVGIPAGLIARSATPDGGVLLGVVAVGVAVWALWAVLGVGIGTLVPNLAGALTGTLIYLLVGELLISLLLNRADSVLVARLSSYLPGNAGDVALYDLPARAQAGDAGRQVVEFLAGVTQPPPWWGGLITLAVWTALAATGGWALADRRDVT